MSVDLEAQIIDLQTRLAHQEDEITSLSETVAGQDKDIAQLKARYNLLQERFKGMKVEMQAEPDIYQQERPPHY